MKKALFLLPLLALVACGYSAMDAAEAVSDVVKGDFDNGTAITAAPTATAAFTKLSLLGPDNVTFTVGDNFQISATGDPQTVEKLRYLIEGGTIKIGRTNSIGANYSEKAAIIRITAPSLSAVSLSGSGDLSADLLAADNVDVTLAGSGDIAVAAVRAKTTHVSVAGSGNLKIVGKSGKAKISLAGSGDIDASKLATENADLSVAGSGNVSLTATGEVNSSLVGSGDVNVTGGAKCTSSKTGSGTVTCA
jgi:hypothetical protein